MRITGYVVIELRIRKYIWQSNISVFLKSNFDLIVNLYDFSRSRSQTISELLNFVQKAERCFSAMSHHVKQAAVFFVYSVDFSSVVESGLHRGIGGN